jgi:hypothetical protein
VKHLNEETEPLRKFHRQSKYEVGSAEWNPSLANCHLCAISVSYERLAYFYDEPPSHTDSSLSPFCLPPIKSNTRVEILSFMGNNGHDLQPTHSLRAHTRVVSDLNWHPNDPDILATCSIDTYIHIWDIRDQRKPSLSLSAVGVFCLQRVLPSPHNLFFYTIFRPQILIFSSF